MSLSFAQNSFVESQKEKIKEFTKRAWIVAERMKTVIPPGLPCPLASERADGAGLIGGAWGSCPECHPDILPSCTDDSGSCDDKVWQRSVRYIFVLLLCHHFFPFLPLYPQPLIQRSRKAGW